MPSCSLSKNPKGQEIKFEEATHRYTSFINDCLIEYTSGTGFVAKYFPPFDPTGSITAKSAAKAGVSVEALKASWAAKAKESADFGTKVHECCEDIFLSHPLRNTPYDEKSEKTFSAAVTQAKKIKNTLNILGVEQIVFDPALRLAGTIDFLGKTKTSETYVIIDHKTNKDLGLENTYNSYANPPIQHIPGTSFGHYTIQLNLYEYLLRFGGYVPKNATFKLYLNHITEAGACLIPVPDAQAEIKDLIIDYLCYRQIL